MPAPHQTWRIFRLVRTARDRHGIWNTRSQTVAHAWDEETAEIVCRQLKADGYCTFWPAFSEDD